MSNYDIGITGLSAAQRALDTIGNNIANAATEGYHRQRVELSPAYASQSGNLLLGGGVEIKGVTRLMDGLLEQEILNQSSQMEHCVQEYDTLTTVENAFSEFSGSSGLNITIDNFFNSLKNLTLDPGGNSSQSEVKSAADSMAIQFRSMGEFLNSLESQITLEVQNVVENANSLIHTIVQLNYNVEKMNIAGQDAGNLMDKRDQAIADLSKLVGVQTQNSTNGVVDVSVSGIPVVTGTASVDLEAGYDQYGKLGITPAGAFNYNPAIEGGKLGGLLSLGNNLIADIHQNLNNVASQIIKQVNQVHVQGVGSSGSFESLTGWSMVSDKLSDFEPPVNDGNIYIRITNTSTGEVTRHEIAVDSSSDTLSTIASAINSITGMSASANSSKLNIQAQLGYKFDFLPAVMPHPTVKNLTSSSPPVISVSGIYNGTQNQDIAFTVVGTGTVGNGGLKLRAVDGGGNVSEYNIGSGYVPGSKIDLGNGVKIELSAEGVLNDGDTFEVEVLGNSDTSGVLAATGINTFFSGTDADDIAVSSDIMSSPGRIATSLGSEMNDGSNLAKLVELKDKKITDLNNTTISEYYHELVANVGQDVSLKKMRQESLDVQIKGLKNQQSEISGVDINNEAAQMIIFQQMFGAMAKYISTVQNSMDSLMNIIR